MSKYFSDDFKFNTTLTNDLDLDGPSQFMSADEVEEYLNSDPRHAVVLHGSVCNVFGHTDYEPKMYVVRGAGEGIDQFWFGEMPAEDPGDATGGDLTASEALHQATIEYYE